MQNLKRDIREIIMITLETEGDEEIDEIRKRYEQLNFDSFSLY
jgi:acyl carrier protein